jgi:hypothetical protein
VFIAEDECRRFDKIGCVQGNGGRAQRCCVDREALVPETGIALVDGRVRAPRDPLVGAAGALLPDTRELFGRIQEFDAVDTDRIS